MRRRLRVQRQQKTLFWLYHRAKGRLTPKISFWFHIHTRLLPFQDSAMMAYVPATSLPSLNPVQVSPVDCPSLPQSKAPRVFISEGPSRTYITRSGEKKVQPKNVSNDSPVEHLKVGVNLTFPISPAGTSHVS